MIIECTDCGFKKTEEVEPSSWFCTNCGAAITPPEQSNKDPLWDGITRMPKQEKDYFTEPKKAAPEVAPWEKEWTTQPAGFAVPDGDQTKFSQLSQDHNFLPEEPQLNSESLLSELSFGDEPDKSSGETTTDTNSSLGDWSENWSSPKATEGTTSSHKETPSWSFPDAPQPVRTTPGPPKFDAPQPQNALPETPGPRIRTRWQDKNPVKIYQKILTGLFLVFSLTTIYSYSAKGEFVDSEEILPELLKEPIQKPTEKKLFTFEYAEETYETKPVAEYELWGLVVSHNDIGGIGDIYHDDSSVDTKDLCIIWGDNLTSDDFHKAEFESGSFTCFYTFPSGANFNPHQFSNNHLITSKPDLREKIDDVHIGDQVHIKGLLVDYRGKSTPMGWRRTSKTRTDIEGGACEVIFVEELNILRGGTPAMYSMYTLGWWLIILILIAKIGLFFGHARFVAQQENVKTTYS